MGRQSCVQAKGGVLPVSTGRKTQIEAAGGAASIWTSGERRVEEFFSCSPIILSNLLYFVKNIFILV